MAKYKPAGRSRKPSGPERPNAIGCIILLILGFIAVFAMLYFTFTSA
jgi:hypothetical protein